MRLRGYRSGDCEKIAELFYDTVHSVNSADYSETLLDAWAPKETDLQAWNKRLLQNSYAVVAERDGVIVGIGTADDVGYFDLLYVHKDYQRMGVASALADDIERYLYGKNVQAVTADVSVTAKLFFEKRGYAVLKEQSVEIRGQFLTNFKMQKTFF